MILLVLTADDGIRKLRRVDFVGAIFIFASATLVVVSQHCPVFIISGIRIHICIDGTDLGGLRVFVVKCARSSAPMHWLGGMRWLCPLGGMVAKISSSPLYDFFYY